MPSCDVNPPALPGVNVTNDPSLPSCEAGQYLSQYGSADGTWTCYCCDQGSSPVVSWGMTTVLAVAVAIGVIDVAFRSLGVYWAAKEVRRPTGLPWPAEVGKGAERETVA